MKNNYLLNDILEYKTRLRKDDKERYYIKKFGRYLSMLEFKKNFILYRKKYEKRWRKLCTKFEKIRIVGVEFVSIGETIPRLFLMRRDFEKEDKSILNVVLPIFYEAYTGGIYNEKILELFGRDLYFVTKSNIDFWAYVLAKHAEMIDKRAFHQYYARKSEYFPVQIGKPLLPFTEKQIKEAEPKMKQMGIRNEFICLHARENRAKELDWAEALAKDTSCRDCDINSYKKACLYMESLGIQSVRMGKYEIRKCNIPGVIDYANNYYDELMDFYLLSKSKFILGSDSGLPAIAGFWGCPMLMTNMVPICYGFESCPNTGFDMYIIKKYYSQKEKRYLNLYEILDASNECDMYNSRFRKRGIILENNTEDEILEATKEMNERIDGCWVISAEEEEDMKKYHLIMDSWKNKHTYVLPRRKCKGYMMPFHKMSYSFLKKNRYLLDVDDSLLENNV